MESSRRWFRNADSLAKGRAADNVRRSDPIANLGKMVADYRRMWAKEDRVVRVVKPSKPGRRRSASRRRRRRWHFRKARADQNLADIPAEQAGLTAQICQQAEAYVSSW